MYYFNLYFINLCSSIYYLLVVVASSSTNKLINVNMIEA